MNSAVKKRQSNHSLQRKAYRHTRSLLRWYARPITSQTSQKKLVICTNVQNSSVAGISRVLGSFVTHTQQVSHTPIEMVCLAILPDKQQKQYGTWHKSIDTRTNITLLTYDGLIPELKKVFLSVRTLDDMQRAYAPLINAYQTQLKEIKPDVVLVNGTYFVPWCLAIAARRLRIPVVHHYHGSLTKETEHWSDTRLRRLMHAMERSFDKLDTKYVFPSALIKEYVEKNIFHHALYKRALVLPNPIPDEFFKTKKNPHRKGVAFVGRWTRIKNISFLERFVDINYRQGTPLTILVVTDANGKKRARKVLHEKVIFAGPFAEPSDMATFYAGVEAILCPSYFETYGNVAQEAVASGTPAFVSSAMGVSEVLKKVGLGNLVIDFKNPRAVYESMCTKKLPVITKAHRRALQEEAGAAVIHEKLLDFIKR